MDRPYRTLTYVDAIGSQYKTWWPMLTSYFYAKIVRVKYTRCSILGRGSLCLISFLTLLVLFLSFVPAIPTATLAITLSQSRDCFGDPAEAMSILFAGELDRQKRNCSCKL
ncbi:uncharacterized protein LOC122041432 [Zingiber officinale]|uniref:uncharacterized protein LOC122041432 n=1 Tax=Zingiber officinale TaxID=94328 RepID=UPI001C4D615C|nr:uncharacterized protein LOC122041432 [Zingiber officinale]